MRKFPKVRGTIRAVAAICLTICLAGAISASLLSGTPPQKQPAIPPQAQKSIQAGQKAEKAGDWQAAYAAYQAAEKAAPQTEEIQLLVGHARFQLVQQHMDEAERQILAGDTSKSEAELRAAIALDPSYKIAQERLDQIQSLATPQTVSRPAQLASPVVLKVSPGLQTFDFRGDVRSAYQQVAERFGVHVQFDADLRPGAPIRVQVPDVDFETAMKVLGSETHTFWATIDDKDFAVADDTPAKRKQYEPMVTETFQLPESSDNAEMTDTMRAIREIAGVNHTSLNTATREITVRDTPYNVAVAGQLVHDIELGHGELVLEMELLEVDKTTATQIGLVPPASATVTPLPLGELQQLQDATNQQQILQIIQNIFGTTSGGGALGGLLPPLTVFGGGISTFFTTLPSAQFGLSGTYSMVHSAQRVLLRAEDNKPATLFIGERYPITLAELSANLTGSSSTPGAPQVTNYIADEAPTAILSVSLRSNGILDLVAANENANTISVFLGNGNGTFNSRTDISVGNMPVALATADFNGDGKPDIAVVNQKDNTVQILFGNGDGTFTTGPLLTTGNEPTAIVTADFNTSNAFPGLAVTNFKDNTVSVFLNNGTGQFAPAPTPTFATGTGPQAIASADFNNDGIPDLAVVNETDNTVSVYLGNGNGTFKSAASVNTTGTTPTSIVAAAFTTSGNIDFAVTDQDLASVDIFLGNGNGTFAAGVSYSTGNEPTALVTGDFNGDGIPDLITANYSDNTISVLLGEGGGVFLNALTVDVGAGPVALTAGVFSNNFLLDAAVAAQSGNVISVVLNNSTLTTNPNPAETPYPGSTYEDLGLKVKMTPHVHPDGDVTMDLSIEIKSLEGSSINQIPIITNRSIEQVIRVRENQPTLLSGISDIESVSALGGIPGIAQIPGAGIAGGNTSVNNTDTELLIVVTPHIVRQPIHPKAPIYVGPSSTAAGPGTP
jgi:type II secretory pathway component GspD/PulD (secretin)